MSTGISSGETGFHFRSAGGIIRREWLHYYDETPSHRAILGRLGVLEYLECTSPEAEKGWGD